MKFEKLNLNPSGRKAFDCVIRSIVKASGKTWLEVFDGLTKIARVEFCIPNEKRAYEIYLENIGFKKQRMPRFADNTRYTVAEFADAYSHGTFVVSVARHLTCVENGTLYDTWNCGHKSVGNYWIK